jgi:hypothetical protein
MTLAGGLPDQDIWEIVCYWENMNIPNQVGSMGVYSNRKDAEKEFDKLTPKPYVRYFLCKVSRDVVAFHAKQNNSDQL